MRIRNTTDLAAVIRERRAELGLDQRTLAKQAGVSRKWIVEVEGGKTTAAIGLVLRTLRVLGVQLQTEEIKHPAKPGDRPVGVDVNALIDRMKKK